MVTSLCNQVEEEGMEVTTEKFTEKSNIREQKRLSKIDVKQIQRGKEQEEKESQLLEMEAVLVQLGEENIREGKRLSKYMEKQEKKDKIRKSEIMKTERKQQEKEIQLVEMETILLQIGDENIREGRRLSKQHEEQKTQKTHLDAREKKVSRKEMKKEQDFHHSKCIFRKFH